jgi:hypothetical protein
MYNVECLNRPIMNWREISDSGSDISKAILESTWKQFEENYKNNVSKRHILGRN